MLTGKRQTATPKLASVLDIVDVEDCSASKAPTMANAVEVEDTLDTWRETRPILIYRVVEVGSFENLRTSASTCSEVVSEFSEKIPFLNTVCQHLPHFLRCTRGQKLCKMIGARETVIFLCKDGKIKMLAEAAWRDEKYFSQDCSMRVIINSSVLIDEKHFFRSGDFRVASECTFARAHLFVWCWKHCKLCFDNCSIASAHICAPRCEYINLTRNHLQTLEMASCENVKTLWVYYNELVELRCDGMQGLNEICCYANYIRWISLAGCFYLTSLKAYGNYLTDFDISNTPRLEVLALGGNQLRHFGAYVHRCIKVLRLHENQLVTLSVAACPALTSLSAHTNVLYSVYLSECPVVREILLNSNAISRLELINCKGVRRLLLQDNRLTALRLETAVLLRELNITGNSIKFVDLKPFSSKIAILADQDVKMQR